MAYGNGRTGPTKVEKRRLAGGGSCVLTNAHFAELDTLLSQHLGLRRIGDGRRLRVFQDLAVHGLVVVNGSVDKGVAPDRAVAEAAATQRGRMELRKWRSLVARSRAGLPNAAFNDPANRP